jgi:hypothetical protein
VIIFYLNKITTKVGLFIFNENAGSAQHSPNICVKRASNV